jgi:hypothetical protein
MIRPGRSSDSARAVELLKDSHVAAGFDRADGPSGFTFPFDPSCAQRLFLSHLVAAHACVLDVDGLIQGVLLAIGCEHKFGPVWLARETVWWIDPAHRGSAAPRMLDAYESWAKGNGYAFSGMAGMGNDPDVAKLYLRRGYRVAETHYLKAL